MGAVTYRSPEIVTTEHTFEVPLDHADPGGERLSVIIAHDMSNGGVMLDVVVSTGQHFSISIADPHNNLSASNFSASDFLFA